MNRIQISNDSRLVQSGDQVPELCLPATNGQDVNIAEISRHMNAVFFFYPGDGEGLRYSELAGCTAQACSLRDRISELRALNTAVFGVSLQSTARQQAFAEREHLPFLLLSDPHQKLVTHWGIPIWISDMGEQFASRITVIARQGGTVAQVFRKIDITRHVTHVLEAVQSM